LISPESCNLFPVFFRSLLTACQPTHNATFIQAPIHASVALGSSLSAIRLYHTVWAAHSPAIQATLATCHAHFIPSTNLATAGIHFTISPPARSCAKSQAPFPIEKLVLFVSTQASCNVLLTASPKLSHSWLFTWLAFSSPYIALTR